MAVVVVVAAVVVAGDVEPVDGGAETTAPAVDAAEVPIVSAVWKEI